MTRNHLENTYFVILSPDLPAGRQAFFVGAKNQETGCFDSLVKKNDSVAQYDCFC